MQTVRQRPSWIHVRFPNGEVFCLPKSPVAGVMKAVLEIFAIKFLRLPGAVRVGVPGDTGRICGPDNSSAVGLRWDQSHTAPDVVLADAYTGGFKLIFVEAAFAEGALTQKRKEILSASAAASGLRPEEVYFVSAFADRSAPAFRRLVPEIAWGTFAWFAGEPEKLLAFSEGQGEELKVLFRH